jgi:hypothetical protein
MELNSSSTIKGMNLDNTTPQKGEGVFSFMYNGLVESDDHKFTATNEPATIKLTTWKPGFYFIGYSRILDHRVIVFLVNPSTNESEIGYFDLQYDLSELEDSITKLNFCDTCKTDERDQLIQLLEQGKVEYNVLVYTDKDKLLSGEIPIYPPVRVLPNIPFEYAVSSVQLNFSPNHPIRESISKFLICDKRIYFTDGYNPPRYLILENVDEGRMYVSNLQRVPIRVVEEVCPSDKYYNVLDIDQIRIFKNVLQPSITPTQIDETGSLEVGSYQFAIAYSDTNGNKLTKYYNISAPVPIIKDSLSRPFNSIEGSDIQYFTNKSIRLRFDNLDQRFSHYIIGIVKNINGSKNWFTLGPYETSRSNYTYTGNELVISTTSKEEFYEDRPVYDTAEYIADVNGYLFLSSLTRANLPNLQRVANKIKLSWESLAIPHGVNAEKSYKDGSFAANYRGYMRGETYPFGIVFEFADGTDSPIYHIPGRGEKPGDRDLISSAGNDDVFNIDYCTDEDNFIERWKVYDTSTATPTAELLDLSNGDFLLSDDSYTYTETATRTYETIQLAARCRIVLKTGATNFNYSEYNPDIDLDNSDIDTDRLYIINPFTNQRFYLDLGSGGKTADEIITAFANSGVRMWKNSNSEIYINAAVYVNNFENITFDIIPTTPFDVPNVGTFDYCTEEFLVGSNSLNQYSPTGLYPFVEPSRGLKYFQNTVPDPSTNIVQTTKYEFSEDTVFKSIQYFKNSGQSGDPKIAKSILVIDGDEYAQEVQYPFVKFKVSMTTTWNITYPNRPVLNMSELIRWANCHVLKSYEGDFAYWESTETYPCDEDVWGELAGLPIRHHKFPSTSTVPHFTSLNDLNSVLFKDIETSLIMPIGVKLDHKSIVTAFKEMLDQNVISKEDVLKIVGYKIVRGNRVNDATIVAKGLFYDVWLHEKKLGPGFYEKFYYQNYPYNDLRPDPFILSTDNHYFLPGNSFAQKLQRYYSDYFKQSHPYTFGPITIPNFNIAGTDAPSASFVRTATGVKNNRYTFFSPETMFYNPQILASYVRMELELRGIAKGHYMPVPTHSMYRRLRNRGYMWSYVFGAALSLLDSLQIGTSVKFEAAKFVFSTFTASEKIIGILKDLIPYSNFAYQFNSVGNYAFVKRMTTPGHTRRRIDISTYLDSKIQNIGDEHLFNNYNREKTVFVKLSNFFFSPGYNTTTGEFENFDNSRYRWKGRYLDIPSNRGEDDEKWLDNSYDLGLKNPTTIIDRNILSYYGSLVRELPDQYGKVHTIDYVYTNKRYTFDSKIIFNISDIETESNYVTTYEDITTIFGGDIFITKFAFKRHHPYFIDDRKGFSNDADINYSEVGNVGNPTYFYDTIKKLYDDDVNDINDTTNSYQSGDSQQALDQDASAPDSGKVTKKPMKRAYTWLRNVIDKVIGIPSEYFEYQNGQKNSKGNDKLGENGYMYLYSMGVPQFFVESVINTEVRFRGNEFYEDFYPHVGGSSQDIPDDWLSIPNLNQLEEFNYNRDMSNQNVDNPFYPQVLEYNPNDTCYENLTNRVVYSQQSNSNEKLDNWLLFRVNDKNDFNLKLGRLKGVHQFTGDKIFVQFENGSSIFNAYNTLQVGLDQKTIYTGNNALFSSPGQELSNAQLGYAGSQHNAYILTELGAVWVDAKRGVVMATIGGMSEISSSNKNWFKSNLPFFILRDFNNVNIDNPYHYKNPIGILITYDNKYQRVIITKHDAKLLPNVTATYNPTNHTFYNKDGKEIAITDTNYFIQKSFTISYSLTMKEWSGFHSYIPTWYISQNQFFLSGNNNNVYTHLQTNKAFQVVYGKVVEFMLEIPHYYKGVTAMLGTVQLNMEALEYYGWQEYRQRLTKFFNKAIIYNKHQTTGLLNLIWKDPNNDDLAIDYPYYRTNSVDILYSSKDTYYTFNHIWNILDTDTPVWRENVLSPVIKTLNVAKSNYDKNTDDFDRMRGPEVFVRMINDKNVRFKFKVYFESNKTENSIY